MGSCGYTWRGERFAVQQRQQRRRRPVAGRTPPCHHDRWSGRKGLGKVLTEVSGPRPSIARRHTPVHDGDDGDGGDDGPRPSIARRHTTTFMPSRTGHTRRTVGRSLPRSLRCGVVAGSLRREPPSLRSSGLDHWRVRSEEGRTIQHDSLSSQDYNSDDNTHARENKRGWHRGAERRRTHGDLDDLRATSHGTM